ncbi:MAG: proton-conducting transporter membrane subunit, partial [Pseudomonadota bacterium]
YLTLVWMANPALQFNLYLIYLLCYAPMLFLCLYAIGASSGSDDSLSTLRNLHRKNPWCAFLMAAGLLSLAGIPPLPGFWAKIAIVEALILQGHTLLAIIAFLGSYIGIYAYFRLIGQMYLEESPSALND